MTMVWKDQPTNKHFWAFYYYCKKQGDKVWVTNRRKGVADLNVERKLFKVIIAGGRDFNNYDLLRYKLNLLLKNKLPDVEVVCGGARGADHLGRVWAIEKGLNVRFFEADWNTHGKKAGILRNCEMGDYADALIAFHDGQSRGTKHMVEYATKKNLLVRVVRYTSRLTKDGDQFTSIEETF